MNCERSIELLPWLLNGTLDPEERRQVLEHVGGCASCRQALADTRLAWQIFDQHLPSEALVALAWGEAPAGVDPSVAELHLATCPECAAELELVRTSRHLEEDEKIAVLAPRTRPSPVAARRSLSGWRAAALAAGLAGVVASAGWLQTAQRANSLESQLAQRPAVTAPAPAEPQPSGSVPSAPAGGAGDQVAELKRKLDESEKTQAALQQKAAELDGRLQQLSRLAQGGPRINIPVIQLTALVQRGSPDEVKEIPAAGDVELILTGDPSSKPYPSYSLEILDAKGKAVWSAQGLRRNQDTDDYTLSLRGSLPPGTYTIQVYGRNGSTREPVEKYQIRVE
jgi:Putative zinc-finger